MLTHTVQTHFVKLLSLQLLVDKDFFAVIAQKARNSVKPIRVNALKQRSFATAGATVVLHVEINEKILLYNHILFYYEF